MTKKDLIINAFRTCTSVGQESITKNDILKMAQKSYSSISPATVGWVISFLVSLGFIIKTGTGPNGANMYQRIK